MDESSAVTRLEDGRYSVLIGRERYTLSTRLDEKTFCRVIESVASLVGAGRLPANISQNEALLLALVYTANEIDKLQQRLSELEKKLGVL